MKTIILSVHLLILLASGAGQARAQLPQVVEKGEVRPLTCDEILNPGSYTVVIKRVGDSTTPPKHLTPTAAKEELSGCLIEEICLSAAEGASIRVCCGSPNAAKSEAAVCFDVSTDGKVGLSLILPNMTELGFELDSQNGLRIKGDVGNGK